MWHKTSFKITFFLLVMLLGIILVAGCGSKEVNKNGKTVVKVGYFPNMTHAQALVGFGDGTFQKALGDGVVIEEHKFNAGPAEIEALLAGEIDLGYIGPVPAVNGFAKSKGKLQIIAGSSTGGAVLLARKGVKIDSPKDLDGKKVAVPQLGNTQDISLRNLLEQANLKDAAKGGTVTIIPAENPDIFTLIAKGDVDAALVPEPWGSTIVKQAGARIVLDSNEIWRDGNYATAVVIVNTDFLNKHPDLVEKWLTAHVDITERVNKDKEGSKILIKNQLKKLTQKELPEDILNSSFARITVTNDPVAASIKEFTDISFKNGYLKEKPDISNLFNFELVNKILEQKGLPQLSGL